MNRHKLLRVYASQQGLHWTINGVAIPVLVLIFQSKGLNLQQIGLVMATWVGSTAMLEIPLGGVADKYGRKNTYLWSLVVNIFGCIALYFAADVYTLMLSAFLLGGARAIYSGTLDAWFYDRFNSAQGGLTYHQAIAKVNVLVTLGLALGALIGGWLPDYVVESSLALTSIYDLNIIVIAIANLVLMFVTWLIIDDKPAEQHSAADHQQTGILAHSTAVVRESLSHDVLKRLMQTMLVYGLVLSSIENYWQPFLSAIISNGDYGVSIFGIITALYFLMSSASSLFSVRLLRLFSGSHRMLMFTTRTMSGLVFIALAFSDDIYSFAVYYLAFFFLFTVGNSSERVLLNDNTKEKQRSTMLSVSSFIMTFGAVISSLLFGYISEQYGIQYNWVICGILLVISSALFVLIPKQRALSAA
ncbi:MFS transporter [Vibrio sp.]|uniref:MFS transporter n=1 Tax=Vibrio sp. TaxID=678 RepID=UPI003D0E7D67